MQNKCTVNDSLTNTINAYLDSRNADGFLFSGPITRNNADQLVTLIDSRTDRRKNVSFFLSTFGGDPNAAYRIGRAFKKHYCNGLVTILIGGYCKSAGTLIALCANELAFGCFGELGPLDTQLDKPNEILGSESGLDLLQALDQITDSAFSSFEQQMLSIVRHSNGAISTRIASEIASALTVGIFSPISGQIDPLRLGIVKRAIEIAQKYGNRLSSDNVKPKTVDRLVSDYPAHGFVIDKDEAKELFEKVREFNDLESGIYRRFDFILRVPSPDRNEFISDLRTDFSPDSDDLTEQDTSSNPSTIKTGDEHDNIE